VLLHCISTSSPRSSSLIKDTLTLLATRHSLISSTAKWFSIHNRDKTHSQTSEEGLGNSINHQEIKDYNKDRANTKHESTGNKDIQI